MGYDSYDKNIGCTRTYNNQKEGKIMDYRFILCLAIILISTKVLGLFSRKVSMPAVVGALIAGVILGPSFLNWIPVDGETGTFIEYTAEIGVILLMFTAGLETNMEDLKANAKASFVTALVGVIVPLIGGAVSFALFFHLVSTAMP